MTTLRIMIDGEYRDVPGDSPIAALVQSQPGYHEDGRDYALAPTADRSEVRLYAAVGGRWMDASLGPVGIIAVSADGWSLHAPDSTDEAIASGDAPALASAPWSS